MFFRNQYIQNILVYNQYELFCTSVLTSPIAVAWHVHHSQRWGPEHVTPKYAALVHWFLNPKKPANIAEAGKSLSFSTHQGFSEYMSTTPRYCLPVLEGRNFLFRNTEKNWGERALLGPCSLLWLWEHLSFTFVSLDYLSPHHPPCQT